MLSPVDIAGRSVGPGNECFVIAEAGVNHNGRIDLARKLIAAAAEADVDAVKFQSFAAETLVTRQTPKAAYQLETTGAGGGQFEMLKALQLTMEQQLELKQHCEESGLVYLCTPYEEQSVDMLDAMDVAAYKVASTDTTNLPLLAYIASKRRAVILSTGMSSLGEVEAAIGTLTMGGLAGKIVLLHCTSEYPVPVREVNLRAILSMQLAFGCPVGFSDHTEGVGASPWAVAIGACVIEKHFTLDRSLPGPDHRASLEPEELKELVTTVREIETALGDGMKRLMPSESKNKSCMQKSLVARRSIEKGDQIRREDLTAKRPATGLGPEWLDKVVSRRAAKNIASDEVLTLGSVNWND